MKTHTPGPWIKDRNLITDQDGQDIATVTYHQNGYVQANARLIAAAPELLAALEATLIPLMRLGDFIGNTDSGGASGLGAFDRCAIIGRVRDAIDKAKTEGREGV
jgi:hypothetical protein